MDQKILFSISNRDEQKIGPQFLVIFGQKLDRGWVGGCKFSKIVVKVGVGVAKLKKIVVDVEVGVTISKKIGLWLGWGMFLATKLWCCCGCGWYRS